MCWAGRRTMEHTGTAAPSAVRGCAATLYRHDAPACGTCMYDVQNLSAPFIVQVPPFKKVLTDTLPFIDFLFGNEVRPLSCSLRTLSLAAAAHAGRSTQAPVCSVPCASGACGHTRGREQR